MKTCYFKSMAQLLISCISALCMENHLSEVPGVPTPTAAVETSINNIRTDNFYLTLFSNCMKEMRSYTSQCTLVLINPAVLGSDSTNLILIRHCDFEKQYLDMLTEIENFNTMLGIERENFNESRLAYTNSFTEGTKKYQQRKINRSFALIKKTEKDIKHVNSKISLYKPIIDSFGERISEGITAEALVSYAREHQPNAFTNMLQEHEEAMRQALDLLLG